MELLEQKKNEILQELSKVREEHQKLETVNENNIKIEQILDTKKKEIIKLIQQYDYKIFSDEYNFIINISECEVLNESENKTIYRYKLPYVLENVMQITFLDHNFTNNLYNITPYNNLLVLELNSETNIQPLNEETTECKYKYDDNKLFITIDSGKYNLDILIQVLNTVLNKFKFEIGYDPIKYIIYIKSLEDTVTFKLIKDVNDIYTTLGFDNQSINTLNTKHIGSKMVDLNVSKQVSINICNIKNSLLDKVNFKVNLLHSKILSDLMIIKPSLNKLEYLDLIFTDEKGKPFWLNHELNLTISIKGNIVEEDKQKYINKIIIN